MTLENPYLGRVATLQADIQEAELKIESARAIHDEQRAELMRMEAQKDLDLAKERLEYALRGENPDIPVYKLRVQSVQKKVDECTSEREELLKLPDSDLRELQLREIILDIEHYTAKLNAEKSALKLHASERRID